MLPMVLETKNHRKTIDINGDFPSIHSMAMVSITRPNSWAKQVREIERGHWILDFMIYEMKNGEGKV